MTSIGQRYCEVCNIYITRKNFCQHLKTRRHMTLELSKQSQLGENYNSDKPPTKKTRVLQEEKTNTVKKNKVVCEKPSVKEEGNQEPNLSADDILHYIGELAKPLNDPNLPCDCSICVEAAKYMGLTRPDPTLNYNNENIPMQSSQLPELVNENCIDSNCTYNNMIVFPPTYLADEKKMQHWKSMMDFAQKFNVPENESKKNNELDNFTTSFSTEASPQLSMPSARQPGTHHCCSFGEELPDYLHFSHCREEMFHFFSIRDKRTDCKTLFVVMK